MAKYHDKHGKEIREGDMLYNEHDREGPYRVYGYGDDLYLGSYDSPLVLYNLEEFWEIVDGKKRF